MNAVGRAAPLLVARDLAVTPPGAAEPAVRGCSLAVSPGEWVALAGPNGGGKTSLLLGLAGLWPTSAGRLELDGAPFGPDTRARLGRGVAVILQDPSSQLLESTVGEELAATARNLGQPEPAIAQAVARWAVALGLADDLECDPATLSAGRQQMVLLGAALVPAPRLLLADEPTAHLDAQARARVRELIAQAVRGGLAVVWATQDPDECALAMRTLPIGARLPEVPAAAQGPAVTGSPTRLTVRISPPAGTGGPLIHLERALEVRIPGRGVTALIGRNGVGKSVLLAALAGVGESPQVIVQWEAKAQYPAIIALQYPELQIFEEEVADEVVFAAVARGVGRGEALAAATRCFRSMGLDENQFMARRTWTLSTGEKRLVEVVGSLIAPADLVLLDEPTGGLDPLRRRSLAALVTDRAAVVPVVVASQDLGWVTALGAGVAGVVRLGPAGAWPGQAPAEIEIDRAMSKP